MGKLFAADFDDMALSLLKVATEPDGLVSKENWTLNWQTEDRTWVLTIGEQKSPKIIEHQRALAMIMSEAAIRKEEESEVARRGEAALDIATALAKLG